MSAAERTSKVTRFAVCVDNTDLEVSLELGTIYPVIDDLRITNALTVRVIDESGEDYPFDVNRFEFLPITTPIREAVMRRCEKTSRKRQAGK